MPLSMADAYHIDTSQEDYEEQLEREERETEADDLAYEAYIMEEQDAAEEERLTSLRKEGKEDETN